MRNIETKPAGLRHRTPRPNAALIKRYFRMWRDFPDANDLNRHRFERELLKAPAPLQYAMFFTPRSGSSWVTDVVSKADRIGMPGEYFNPNHMNRIAQALNATTLEEYRDILVRRRVSNGVFGFQITEHQLRAVFGDADTFMRYFPQKKCFWLIREDIVLQGISLFKMQHTQISHAPQASDEELRQRENLVSYNGREIKQWIRHIHVAEIGTEALIQKFDLDPFRMSYERNTKLAPRRLVKVMSRYLGAAKTDLDAPQEKKSRIESVHKKIGTDINLEFADRFRAENARFIAELDAARQPMLDQLRDLKPSPAARKNREDG